MENYNLIVSKENSLVKKIVRLANERKFRENSKLAVIYGEHLIIEALKHNLVTHLIILEEELNNYQSLLNEHSKLVCNIVSAEVMKKINVLDSMVDIAAVIKIVEPGLMDNCFNQDCLVLENIQDPGNLGTILRAATASGVQNIILSKACVDLYNPKVLRASQGMQFGLNIYYEIDLGRFLSNYSGQVLAFTPHSDRDFYQQDLRLTSALVLGNEGNGLSDEILSQIKNQVSIPMLGDAESLNLAMATTIALFEMARQRLNAR